MNSLARKKNMSSEALSFILCCAVGFFIFLPFLIVDKGFFLFCGDYNSQQIPFYHYVNSFFKNGGGQYSWNTDLGGSIVNSYSFYLMGSPFFWLSSIFPASWAPYLMVPLFSLKFGVAGLSSFMYLKRYCKNINFAILGAVLYACSGQMVYNTFFNHFLDCIALFPFMLWALDGFIYDKKYGPFVFFVALNLINNYFFFAGEIVFLFIYFFVKLLTGEYKITLSRFGRLALESILGVGLGCLLLIPAAISLADNPRTVNLSNGFGLLLYGKVQQYFAIFQSLFFPPDPPYLPNLFTEGVVKWTSMSAFLPIVGCAGAIAFIKARKGSAARKIMLICLFMAMVPGLNSLFIMMNSSYYARWYYMPVLIMCLATMQSLECEDIRIEDGLKTVFVITLGFGIFGIVPQLKDEKWRLGVVDEPARFWLTWLSAIFMLLIFVAIINFKKHKKSYATALISAVLGFTVIYSVIYIALGKFPQWDNDSTFKLQTYDTSLNNEVLPNDTFYRTDSYGTQDNLSLWLKKPNLHFFNSTVTPSIMEFYPSIGVKRDVSSKPDADKYAVHGLLSVKYMIVLNDKRVEFDEKYKNYGWEIYSSDDVFTYYENTNYIPMGFAYSYYIKQETLDNLPDTQRATALMRGIALSPEQEEKYSSLYMGEAELDDMTHSRFMQDAINLRQNSAYYFDATQNGFTAKINLSSDSLVFFSVPFDKGFTATVNGEEREIEKVSNGMSAVLCPQGESEIVFKYKTPGLALSTAVTAVSALSFLGYLYFSYSRKKRKKEQPGISYVKFSEEHLTAAADIEKHAPDPWTREQIATELLCDAARLYAAVTESGELIAFCALQCAASEASLNTIAVMPEMRKKGIAKELLRYAFSQIDAEEVFLEVRTQNQSAIALYNSLGFEHCGIRHGFYENPCDDALIMKLNLKEQK